MSNYRNDKKSLFLLLHISLLFSSLSGVCSKLASGYTDNIFSIPFLFWFGLVFVIMFGYAIIWQQVLKRMPLTIAYANKPVTLIWGIIWGRLIFGEKITWNMLVGACVIFLGIYFVTTQEEPSEKVRTDIMSKFGGAVCLLLVSVFISSVSQILLKKAANKTYEDHIREYLNPLVIFAYGMFFCSVILTMLALKNIPLSMQPILESTGYIVVTVMGYFFLKERIGKRKMAGIALILLGILIFSM